MLFAELNLEALLSADDGAFGPETMRGEVPEALCWSTFCDVLERIEPRPEPATGAPPPAASLSR